jgi:DNA-binding protein YbaB
MTELDLDYFRALEQQYQETMAKARAGARVLDGAIEELKDLRGWARSAQGHVEAEANGNGALTNLRLDDSVTRLSPKLVGQIIVATAAAAVGQAFDHRERVFVQLQQDLKEPEL